MFRRGGALLSLDIDYCSWIISDDNVLNSIDELQKPIDILHVQYEQIEYKLIWPLLSFLYLTSALSTFSRWSCQRDVDDYLQLAPSVMKCASEPCPEIAHAHFLANGH